jgi:hypothetical protein
LDFYFTIITRLLNLDAYHCNQNYERKATPFIQRNG